MSEKRRRERCEYNREYKRKKKEKAMMSKREKSERYYMGKDRLFIKLQHNSQTYIGNE